MNLKLITMMKKYIKILLLGIYMKSLCSHDFIFTNLLARLKYVETKQAKESNVYRLFSYVAIAFAGLLPINT